MKNHNFKKVGGELFYEISDLDKMPPFLMSINSAADHWMFLSSNSALCAGRQNAGKSLFPYLTDDKIHQSLSHTGPVTKIRWKIGAESALWEPFASCQKTPDCKRALLKNASGSHVIFEEFQKSAGLRFRRHFQSSKKYGIVMSSEILNESAVSLSLQVLNGLQNIMPAFVDNHSQNTMSNLVNAYKMSELLPGNIAAFFLAGRMMDRPQPGESLRASTVWSTSDSGKISLSSNSIAAFMAGESFEEVAQVNGQSGAFLQFEEIQLAAKTRWGNHLVADVWQSAAQIVALQQDIADSPLEKLQMDLQANQKALEEKIAKADGMQKSGEQLTDWHHFASVQYNIMRGGLPDSKNEISIDDFARFLEIRNKATANKYGELLKKLPTSMRHDALQKWVENIGDSNLLRLFLEYLPFSFSRRHGDPSRPWNQFDIQVEDAFGKPILNYEGNWRDIFQNWDALSLSFPQFLENFVAKFVNASTADGFNPYRISRQGIDWEIVDPQEPWSFIGYWGDHQIPYLLKFLENFENSQPERFAELLQTEIFSTANVPYRLKNYKSIAKNAKDTIDFDADLHEKILLQVPEFGEDARLLRDAKGNVQHSKLLEKLLIPVLSKLANFVPGGGIWMNTQRPEWNDANNALVGNGLSMVTLFYLRRYINFFRKILLHLPDKVHLHREVADWFQKTAAVFSKSSIDAIQEPKLRRKMLDEMGQIFSDYRDLVVGKGFSDSTEIGSQNLAEFFDRTLQFLDASIAANRRKDGLFHSYNLLSLGEGEASVDRLPLMLEGQVAAITSGVLASGEILQTMESLFASDLYCPRRKTFILYPEKKLPGFLERNLLPQKSMEIPLLKRMAEADDCEIFHRDAAGNLRFSADFVNADSLNQALDTLAISDDWREDVQKDRESILQAYEETFNHYAFTGRSGSMFAYEGIGSVYWHMVSKLLLALGQQANEAEGDFPKLAEFYFRVREGLGYKKSPQEYGAFPSDPYSHTPAHLGAQQPGMTGQVKEDVICRFLELGLHLQNGQLQFAPKLLKQEEFLDGVLAFSYCRVPVKYVLADSAEITWDGGRIKGSKLDKENSAKLLNSQFVDGITVKIPKSKILE